MPARQKSFQVLLAFFCMSILMSPLLAETLTVLDDFSRNRHSDYTFVPVHGSSIDSWNRTNRTMSPKTNSPSVHTWFWEKNTMGPGDSVSVKLRPQAVPSNQAGIRLNTRMVKPHSIAFNVMYTAEGGINNWQLNISNKMHIALGRRLNGPTTLKLRRGTGSEQNVIFWSVSGGGLSATGYYIRNKIAPGARLYFGLNHLALATTSFDDLSFINNDRNTGTVSDVVDDIPYNIAHINNAIYANNIFALEAVFRNKQWYMYYGGWLTSAHGDKIYLKKSKNSNLSGNWTEPMMQLTYGDWPMINDPSIAVDSKGTYHMLYTLGKLNNRPTKGRNGEYLFIEWIGHSTSHDGLSWSSNKGLKGNSNISISDSENLVGGKLSGCARPSLVKDGKTWRLWFDGSADYKQPACYLATSTGPTPTNFKIVKKYAPAGFFPGFWEPDVHKLSDGSFVAVINRGFTSIYYGTSKNGVDFKMSKKISAAKVGAKHINNPSLLEDGSGKIIGIIYGKTSHKDMLQNQIGWTIFSTKDKQ